MAPGIEKIWSKVLTYGQALTVFLVTIAFIGSLLNFITTFEWYWGLATFVFLISLLNNMGDVLRGGKVETSPTWLLLNFITEGSVIVFGWWLINLIVSGQLATGIVFIDKGLLVVTVIAVFTSIIDLLASIVTLAKVRGIVTTPPRLNVKEREEKYWKVN